MRTFFSLILVLLLVIPAFFLSAPLSVVAAEGGEGLYFEDNIWLVEVEVRSEVQVGRVVADAEGLWSWTPPNSLAPGEHRYRARIIDGEVVGEWSEYRTFMVLGETSEAGEDELTDKSGGGSEIPRTGASSAWALAAGLGLMSLGLGGLVMQRRFRDVAGEL